MVYKFHKSNYSLGSGLLKPEQRIVVGTRYGSPEPRRCAYHLGLNKKQPEKMLKHRMWMDGEYLPTFATGKCLDGVADYFRYESNYRNEDGTIKWGEGLRGRTVYIVHTPSRSITPQELNKRVEFIAETAKYQGAENVVLIAYTLNYSAQERGSHDTEHPRMQTEEAMKKCDGQVPLSRVQLKHFLVAGIDAIVTPHNHCLDDTMKLCSEVNDEFLPMQTCAIDNKFTMRYHLNFVHVDLAPMIGLYVADFGEENLDFDLTNKGENVLFLGPDQGIRQFVSNVRRQSGLTNSAMAVMNKTRSDNGNDVERLVLDYAEGLTPERGIEGMDILIMDDVIRSGSTMRKNIDVLRGFQYRGIERDPKILGKPKKVVVYATRTNFVESAVEIMSAPSIDDVIITNADPRGPKELGPLVVNTQVIWINFMLAEAAKSVELGLDPMDILTPEHIRDRKLLKVQLSHDHKKLKSYVNEGDTI